MEGLEDDGAAAVVEEISETLLVWRQDTRVYHRTVDANEAPLLALVEKGARFDRACERLVESVSEDHAAAHALQLLGRWVADELIAAPA
jgi:hypothetical protein